MTVPLHLVRYFGSFAATLGLLIVSFRLAAAELAVPLPADHAERFNRGLELFRKEIRPLLTTHCLKCHGGEKTQSDFSLASREDLLKGGAEGLAVRLFDGPGSKLVPQRKPGEKAISAPCTSISASTNTWSPLPLKLPRRYKLPSVTAKVSPSCWA
jgi:hypothetical protein